MAKMKFSTKQLMINKTNAQMIVIIATASVIVVFSLVSSKALLTKRAYQSRVITKKEAALTQLKINVDEVKKLVSSYNVFEGSTENIIGGSATGTGDRDGDNAKIILDSLPSRYDFPALATSLEKLVSTPNYKINAIAGIDDEINQVKTSSTPTLQPVVMPFELDVTGTYASVRDLINTLDRSIRPFQISKLELSGKDSELKVQITANTFYQPEKSLVIKTEEVK